MDVGLTSASHSPSPTRRSRRIKNRRKRDDNGKADDDDIDESCFPPGHDVDDDNNNDDDEYLENSFRGRRKQRRSQHKRRRIHSRDNKAKKGEEWQEQQRTKPQGDKHKADSMPDASSTESIRHETPDPQTTTTNRKHQKPKKDDGEEQPNPPTARRVKFACAICGRKDFCTRTGAEMHARECDGTSNRKGPWTCKVCGKTDFLTSAAFGGHRRSCHMGNVTKESISLVPVSLESEQQKLSDFNRLLTTSIELVEASEIDVERQIASNGKRHIKLGNIGVRCRYCAKQGTNPIGSVLYPEKLGTLPHLMYTMNARHFMKSCQSIPDTVRKSLEMSKKSSTSQSLMLGRIGLPSYLRQVIMFFGLTDGGREGVTKARIRI